MWLVPVPRNEHESSDSTEARGVRTMANNAATGSARDLDLG